MDVRSRIRSYVAEVIAGPVRDHDDIFDLGIVDSMFAMQLVLFVEREFSIIAERADLDIHNFCSVDALVAFVERKLVSRAASESRYGHPAQ